MHEELRQSHHQLLAVIMNVRQMNYVCMKKVNTKLNFSRFFPLFLIRIYHYAWWHLSCSSWLCECIAHTWRSTKLRLICVRESVHVCVQITQKDSFLLASLYSFWYSLWQISVRGDFICWFIWGQQCDINILCVFWVACFLWLFKEILAWECKMKWEEWFISSS